MRCGMSAIARPGARGGRPWRLERYFEEIAPILREHGPEWTKRYNAAADAYGLTILDDWTDELKERYGITL